MKENTSAHSEKIAIISDIHNNEVNLKKVLDFCAREKIKEIICCGDLATRETLDFFCDNFIGEIFYVFGNMDHGQFSDFEFTSNDTLHGTEYKNAHVFKNYGEINLDNNPEKSVADHGARKIAFIHFPREAKELAETGKYDFVFYGHTHKPWEEMIELPASAKASTRRCKMLNPGNATGDFYPPTFAVWNTVSDKFELIRIHDLK
jgi:putative phosphoesterase